MTEQTVSSSLPHPQDAVASTNASSESSAQPPVGSVATEARRLVEALRARPGGGVSGSAVEQADGSTAHAAEAAHDGGGGGHGEAADASNTHERSCATCPLCVGARAAREAGPDVLESVADLLSLGAGWARRLADHVRADPPDASPDPQTADEDAATQGAGAMTHPDPR